MSTQDPDDCMGGAAQDPGWRTYQAWHNPGRGSRDERGRSSHKQTPLIPVGRRPQHCRSQSLEQASLPAALSSWILDRISIEPAPEGQTSPIQGWGKSSLGLPAYCPSPRHLSLSGDARGSFPSPPSLPLYIRSRLPLRASAQLDVRPRENWISPSSLVTYLHR